MESRAGRGFLTLFSALVVCAVTACLGTAGLVHIVRTCYDTDATGRYTMNTLLWPVVTPALWLGEGIVLGLVFVVCRRFVSRRWELPVAVVCLIAVVGSITWWYWSFGADSLSTGLRSSGC